MFAHVLANGERSLHRVVNFAGHEDEEEMIMLCTIVAMHIFSLPGGPIVVGEVPPNQPVQVQDVSLLRDWAFISKPSDNGVSPRGWAEAWPLRFRIDAGFACDMSSRWLVGACEWRVR